MRSKHHFGADPLCSNMCKAWKKATLPTSYCWIRNLQSYCWIRNFCWYVGDCWEQQNGVNKYLDVPNSWDTYRAKTIWKIVPVSTVQWKCLLSPFLADLPSQKALPRNPIVWGTSVIPVSLSLDASDIYQALTIHYTTGDLYMENIVTQMHMVKQIKSPSRSLSCQSTVLHANNVSWSSFTK